MVHLLQINGGISPSQRAYLYEGFVFYNSTHLFFIENSCKNMQKSNRPEKRRSSKLSACFCIGKSHSVFHKLSHVYALLSSVSIQSIPLRIA